MANSRRGSLAYEAASEFRSQREQEADVFRRATGALRSARQQPGIDQVRAVADNRRLWSAVIDVVRDPSNQLPQSLRASITSVGLAVQREMEAPAPDFDFLISVNENITEGLCRAA